MFLSVHIFPLIVSPGFRNMSRVMVQRNLPKSLLIIFVSASYGQTRIRLLWWQLQGYWTFSLPAVPNHRHSGHRWSGQTWGSTWWRNWGRSLDFHNTNTYRGEIFTRIPPLHITRLTLCRSCSNSPGSPEYFPRYFHQKQRYHQQPGFGIENVTEKFIEIIFYWILLKQNLKQWKQSRIDKVEGVETIDQVHLEPHEYQAEEEVEPQWAEDPGEGDYD